MMYAVRPVRVYGTTAYTQNQTMRNTQLLIGYRIVHVLLFCRIILNDNKIYFDT